MKTFTTCAEKKAKQFFNLLQGYTKGIRITAILILLLMGVGNAWGATQTYVAGEYIYIKNFVPSGWNGTTWILSNSYAWAHMWGGTAGEHDYLFELYSGTAGSSGAIYRAKVTTGGTYTNVIFTRNSSNKGPWDDKWNQTGDIVLDGSSNCFTAFTADGTGKTCSKYAAAPTAATLTLADAISGDGSQANPYNVYEGVNYTLTASGTFPDPGNTKQYAFNNTTYSTTNTKTVSFTHGTTSYYANVRAAEGTTYSTAKKVTIYLNVIQPTYSYTVTAGEGGTVSPASGTVAQGSGVTITATPNDGYEFVEWTATNGTLADASNASTTFTPSANNANATASFKVAGCTQTPTTPTSLTATVEGGALAGEVCSGTNVTLTAGGTISVGSLQWGTGTVGENIIAEGNGRSSITVSPTVTTTYWVRSIITEAGVCYGATSNAKTLQVNVTPALVQPVLSKSTLTLEEGGSTGSITVTSGTTGGKWTSSNQTVATVSNGTVTPKGPGTAAITYTVSNGCEGDKTATCDVTVNAKPYYIAGRLQQNWNTSSKTQQFTYVSNGQYKYETGKTVAELSAQWQDNSYTAAQYFFIHTGSGLSNSFTSSDKNGHNFHQKLGYDNALTLSSNSDDNEDKYIKFADTNDNSSDVVIWWEPSTNKLWYTAQKTYKITYGVGTNKGTDEVTTYPSITSGASVLASTEITFSKGATNAGYTWKNWNSKVDGTGTELETGDTYVSSNRTGDISVYACYDLITYNITYNTNGGTNPNNAQTSYNVTTATFNLPTPTKTGYTFAGWFDNEELTGDAVTQITKGTTDDKTFYAKWLANKYTVIFHANDGEGDMEDQEFTYDEEQALTTNTFTRTGYTFASWNTKADGTGTTYTDGQTVQNLTADNNGTINLYAQWTEIKYTVNISTDGNGLVDPSGDQQIGIEGLEVTATPKDPSRFRFTKWEVSGGAQVADNYGATTTVTATAAGTVIAHFEELQPKTIYLKTVEGTTDGYKWFIKYGGQEYPMDELGCTGEYYSGDVPEQTEFQLIAKDQNGNVIAKETRDGLVVPDDNKNMLNLVSVAASGDKIFFKPNQRWIDKASNDKLHFAGRFWTGSAVWKQMTDDNGDGIYDCEKPTNGNEVIFCLVNKTDDIENWGDNWSYKQIQTNGDDAYKQIPNGSNLFTITDNNEDQATGTWSTHADTPVNGEGEWTIFEGATYRITFDHSGATSGTTTPGVAHVDVQLNSSMPVIELESLPKNTDWKFGGYYTAADGGTAITNAFGDWLDADGYISNGKWVKEECVTLYAHWVEKTPEITNVTLGKDVFDVGSTETTTATPTVVQYAYSGTYVICWKLLDNSGTIMEFFPFTPGDNNSVSFSVDGLTAGTYTVRASIYDTDCDTGEELSRYDAKFTIVSGYKVTVKYLCGDDVIKASDIAPGHATTPMDITAPEIGGYKFVNWELGDGIFSESDLNSQTISYTAIYDGYLTAKYEKRKLIFLDISTLPNKENWTEPHIYLYNSNGYWDADKGAGATGDACVAKGGMTKVPNTENIWYYDYENVNNFGGAVAFTATNKMSQQNFWDCEAIYRTDFTSGTPVFVPASDQTAETKNTNAKYYNKGYWVRYMGGTGYWLIIYNEAGDKELVRREFTSETQRMTMTSIVDLEAKHTYKYEIYRNDGYYYNGGDITYTNSSNYKPLNEANKHSIKTTETGDYTFTLDYFTGDLQIKVQYPGEVGDYRILYTDDVRNGKYKPSQVISQNNEEPLVSFFIRPNDNPVLKIQKATLVTEDEVKWDNKVLYLTPNGNWKADGARFAAAFMNNDKSKTEWVSMTSIKNGDYYGCAIPTGTWTYVIFCRMNGSTTENNWDNKWDQTNDLTIPTNGNNQYTVATGAWSYGSGTWSKHNNDIIDLSNALNDKLRELGLTNIKEEEGTVFNIHLSNNDGTPTIEKVALYTGNYYIRVDALDGKWYDYKTNSDNLMTYSAFSESEENSFGEKFSHYKTKWCTQGTNVKFVIANDYSLCISDTLVQDADNPFGNIDTHGNINNDDKYNANIRFMWNRHTNKVSRAYVAAASDEGRKFLVLKANKTIQNESGHAINNNEVVFQDTQNWLYERTIKVQPGTLVKLYACYPDLDEAKAQHFRGKYSNDFTKDVTAVQILGGNSEEWYTMRIVYDFKTNRLMGAWVPDQNIDGEFEIDADVMVIRQHQEDATCITFADERSTLTEVKTVYGVIRFNRWTLNNRSTSDHKVLPVQSQKSIYERALYFISFPFDVHLSDVFGFGTYGTHWVISEYNGLRRAQRGYFEEDCINEDCTNWDYIWDPSNFTLKANQGYLLSLDLDLMKHDNTSFWAHDIQQVELFFPSYANVETIAQTSYTMPALSEEYLCTINHNTDGTKPDRDRRVKDSYWRCIGVPSFADYNSTLSDGENQITWQPQNGNIPFLYEWNVSDNSLMVRAASKYKFRPTYAYLVQNGQEIHWSAVNTKPSTPIIARQRTEADRNYEWKIALLSNSNQEDQTFLRITDNENVTTDFDFNQDLAKEFNYGRSDIYTLIGYERAAANSMPCSDKTTIIPLGLNIEQAGDYTIAMPEGVENIGITLVDNETGIHTNLSAGQEYTLTLNKGICENRLFIEVSPIQQSTTDLEYTTEDTREQTTRKMLIDGILYLIRDGVIYDAQGHKL